MRTLLTVSASVSALAVTAALAADPVPVPPPMAAPVIAEPAPAPFAGAYAGAFVGYSPFFSAMEVGVQSGYNLVRDRLLFGVEVETSHFAGFATIIDASLVGRVGFIANDRVLVYGQAGLGAAVFTPTWNVGGGVEFLLRDNISVFGEAKASFELGVGYFGTEFRAGVNYHAAGRGPVMATDGFDWSGLYAGVVGGMNTGLSLSRAGVQFGYNMEFGRLLAGIEVQTTITVAPIPEANIGARLGFAVGDRALAFAKVAIGSQVAVPLWSVGGGVEVAVGDRASVFGAIDAQFVVGGGGYSGVNLNAGINIYFGR